MYYPFITKWLIYDVIDSSHGFYVPIIKRKIKEVELILYLVVEVFNIFYKKHKNWMIDLRNRPKMKD